MSVPGILQEIVRKKAASLEKEKQLLPFSDLKSRLSKVVGNRTFSFRRALKGGNPFKPRIIAEVKRGSPSRGLIKDGLDVSKQVEAYEKGGAAAISVITEQDFFFAEQDDFQHVRETTTLPVLRKDFIIDAYQIYQSVMWGADAILLIARLLSDDKLSEFLDLAHSFNMDALVEVHSEKEMERALNSGAVIIGINNRDLDTFNVSLETTIRLARYLGDENIGVCESGIKSSSDIERIMASGVRAFLIGEYFVRSEDPAAAVREFSEVIIDGR